MEILHADKIEGKVAEEVQLDELEEMFDTAQDMIELCKKEEGIGLAATQVGIQKNFFVWTRTMGRNFEVIFNPAIYRDGGFTNVIEGCLSLPGEHYLVKRMKKIMVQYYIYANGQFAKKTEHFKKPYSFVWQHEIEHLQGKTIRMSGVLIDKEKITNNESD